MEHMLNYNTCVQDSVDAICRNKCKARHLIMSELEALPFSPFIHRAITRRISNLYAQKKEDQAPGVLMFSSLPYVNCIEWKVFGPRVEQVIVIILFLWAWNLYL